MGGSSCRTQLKARSGLNGSDGPGPKGKFERSEQDVNVGDLRAPKDLWLLGLSSDGNGIGLEVNLKRREELVHDAFYIFYVDDGARPDPNGPSVRGLEAQVLSNRGRRLNAELLAEARRITGVVVSEERRRLEVLRVLAACAQEEQGAHEEPCDFHSCTFTSMRGGVWGPGAGPGNKFSGARRRRPIAARMSCENAGLLAPRGGP